MEVRQVATTPPRIHKKGSHAVSANLAERHCKSNSKKYFKFASQITLREKS
jgi:hypothetical protein